MCTYECVSHLVLFDSNPNDGIVNNMEKSQEIYAKHCWIQAITVHLNA